MCTFAYRPPAVTTIIRGFDTDRPPGPASDRVTVQLLLPALSAAGVKVRTPSLEMAGAVENNVSDDASQLMLRDTVSLSPTPAEMSVAQLSL
jgi:hypothetical protein